MKRRLILISLLLFVLIGFIGCSMTSESDAKQITTKYLTQFYTLDFKKANDISSGDDAAYKAVSSMNAFKPLMTEDAFNSFEADRMFLRNLQYCSNKKCSIKLKNLNLSRRFCDNKEIKVGYDYIATIEITNNNNSKTSTTEKGYVGVAKVNNEWKIYAYEITLYSDAINQY